MKRTALLIPLLIAGVACERTRNPGLTDEAAIQRVVEEELAFLMDPMGTLIDEDSSYGGLLTAGLTAPIEGQLRVWYRRIDPETRTLDLSIHIARDTAWVDLGRTHRGTFHLWYSPPGDTGPADTLIRYTKDLADTLFRSVLLVRQGSVDEPRRGWRLVAFSIGQGHAYPTTTLRIDSVVVDFYDGVDVVDQDTTDGRVDEVVCSGDRITTLRLIQPDTLIPLSAFPEVPARACAHVRVYGEGQARGFLHFNTRWSRHVRRPLSWNPEGYWEGTWFTPFFVEEGRNRFHVALDLIAEATFTDDTAPYDAVFWFLPYQVRPR